MSFNYYINVYDSKVATKVFFFFLKKEIRWKFNTVFLSGSSVNLRLKKMNKPNVVLNVFMGNR